jgi:ornithine cyclodeaminase
VRVTDPSWNQHGKEKGAMRVVTEDELRNMVGEQEALEAVDAAFRALAQGRVVQPPPLGMDLEQVKGEVHVKGAYLEGEAVFAIKVASGFYNNPELGLPSGSGLVLVFDARTGHPRALLQDNGYLTELRTGGAGALAVQHLAPHRPVTVAVVGAGSQARFQARAMARVRTLQELRVWSPIPEEVAGYVEEMEPVLGLPVEGHASVKTAVEGADLVVTVTPSREPLVQPEWLRSDATVVAVGSDGPEKQELAVGVLGNADKVVVDSRAQCLGLGETHHAVAAGEMAPEEIYAELGQVASGEKAGREGDELIVCDLTGVGAQDAAMAGAVWKLLEGD